MGEDIHEHEAHAQMMSSGCSSHCSYASLATSLLDIEWGALRWHTHWVLTSTQGHRQYASH